MATLILWRWDNPDGAVRAARILEDLPDAQRDDVHDAALATWRRGSATPATRPVPELASDRGLGEGFWGVLFGLIFYSPLLCAAVVSRHEAFTGSIARFGIPDTFVNRVRDTVTPGTSALFVLGSNRLVDHLQAVGEDPPATMLVTQLSRSEEGALREVFVG